jgi:hypothetical protein
MDCSHFAEVLASFQEGSLSLVEQSAAQAHLAECATCHRLLEIARGEIDMLPQAQHDALTYSILDRTSGPACARVESSLWDFIEGDLNADDAHLISLHLENCAECRSVAEDLVLIQQELPEMAEINPGESFAREVVSATRELCLDRSAGSTGFRAWWDRMIQRPRFALEAAYIGALVLFLAFSIPFLSLQSVTLDKMSFAAVQPSEKFVVTAWAGTKTCVSSQVSKIISTVAAKKQDTSEALAGLANGCKSKSTSVLARSAEGIKKWQRDQSIGWLTVWRSVSSWIPLAKL